MGQLTFFLAVGFVVFISFALIIAVTCTEKKWAEPVAGVLVLLGAACLFAGIFTQNTIENCKPKEFPAEKYTLEMKVTYFQGRSDTTYVITVKK